MVEDLIYWKRKKRTFQAGQEAAQNETERKKDRGGRAGAGAGCRRDGGLQDQADASHKERMACEAYTISFPEEVHGDKTLAETILSLCAAQEETEYGTVYDGAALQPYLYQCSEVTEVVSSMDRPMHLNVSYKTQDDIEVSLEIDYDVIVLRSVYYPDEDAYALEQMGKAVWMTHFRYGS